MLFSSMTFIFVFLPSVFLLYFLIKDKFRNYLLLAISIVFYAWKEPEYIPIIFLIIIISYLGAIALSYLKKYKKLILVITVFLDLYFLFYFKYFNFFTHLLSNIFSLNIKFIDIVMPIGISFYTFQTISYIIDVYREEVKVQKNIFKLALYISFFSQLIAGPIIKYNDIEKQIDEREENLEKIIYGIKRFIIGLSKKVLIANTLGLVADKTFNLPSQEIATHIAWIGAISYSFQIFYDFSGYSDMAIGLGCIFGFKISENFNYPYISKSITEFWRRWHISLSSWFKNYLYIPLGGNRKGKNRTYINLFIVFLTTGLWHGASFNFIFWGIYYGIFIIIEKMTSFDKKEGFFISYFKHVYTLIIVLIGWVFFRADNIKNAFLYIKNMFGFLDNKPSFNFIYYIDNIEIITLFFAIICSMPIFRNFLNKPKNKMIHILVNLWLVLLFILSCSSIAENTYNPFIYFRF